jgi:hypothetical protein
VRTGYNRALVTVRHHPSHNAPAITDPLLLAIFLIYHAQPKDQVSRHGLYSGILKIQIHGNTLVLVALYGVGFVSLPTGRTHTENMRTKAGQTNSTWEGIGKAEGKLHNKELLNLYHNQMLLAW